MELFETKKYTSGCWTVEAVELTEGIWTGKAKYNTSGREIPFQLMNGELVIRKKVPMFIKSAILKMAA